MPQRRRHPLTAIAPLAALAALSAAAVAAPPTAQDALALKPRLKGVDYSIPSADEAKQATIKQEQEGGVSALVVRGPSGEVLRAFADSDGNRVVDRWSYYKDGVEVYREIDSDKDTKADQFRWLAGGGSRWAVGANADGTIDAWKAISAEEAAAEIVAAIRDRDAASFARLLPTRADLEAAGFAGDQLAELVARVTAAPESFAKVAGQQKEIGPDAKLANMLTPQPPGTIPAGTNGLTKDVTAYDNVVALVESKQGNGQVFVGALVKCGDAWRPVDAPQVAGGTGDMSEHYSFFSPRTPGRVDGPAQGDVAENLKPLLAKLRDTEAKMSAADPAARKDLAQQYVGLLEQIVAAAADSEKPFWTNQLVEAISAYVQEGAAGRRHREAGEARRGCQGRRGHVGVHDVSAHPGQVFRRHGAAWGRRRGAPEEVVRRPAGVRRCLPEGAGVGRGDPAAGVS